MTLSLCGGAVPRGKRSHKLIMAMQRKGPGSFTKYDPVNAAYLFVAESEVGGDTLILVLMYI